MSKELIGKWEIVNGNLVWNPNPNPTAPVQFAKGSELENAIKDRINSLLGIK